MIFNLIKKLLFSTFSNTFIEAELIKLWENTSYNTLPLRLYLRLNGIGNKSSRTRPEWHFCRTWIFFFYYYWNHSCFFYSHIVYYITSQITSVWMDFSTDGCAFHQEYTVQLFSIRYGSTLWITCTYMHIYKL